MLAAFTAGCGGGGGTSDPGPAPTSKLHTYAAGDQWNYDFAGQETLGGQNLAISGTETRAVTQTTLNGAAVLAITTTDNIDVNNQHVVEQTTSYVQQDPATGDLSLIADTQGAGGSIRTVTGTQIIQQGTFSTGASRSAQITFADGSTQSTSELIQGHSFVTVSAGTYNTWQTLNQKQDSNGITSTDTEWWAPETGAFVKASVSGTEPGFTIHFTLTLTSTTVISGT